MRHTVELKELEGYEVEAEIVSTSGGGRNHAKSLSVITRIGETTSATFRVTDRTERVFSDYANLGDALLDYNNF